MEAHSNFATLRANVCVAAGRLHQYLHTDTSSPRAFYYYLVGKWMYEATLETDGIMQLGWSTVEAKFTNEEGVGDDRDTYALDGQRKKVASDKSCS